MINYTLGLIKQESRILLLNRERAAWMGCWNGVGGKLEPGESPRAAMRREIAEETGLDCPELAFKGMLTWTSAGKSGPGQLGGMFMYMVELTASLHYPTPAKVEEGILDWKEISWIMHAQNYGVASNLPPCLDMLLNDERCYNHHSIFAGHLLHQQHSERIDPCLETDEAQRNQYLADLAGRLRTAYPNEG